MAVDSVQAYGAFQPLKRGLPLVHVTGP